MSKEVAIDCRRDCSLCSSRERKGILHKVEIDYDCNN